MPEKLSEITTRQCLVTKEHLEQDAMLRFVLSPEGLLFPDLDRKLEGRGCWISFGKELLKTAIKKGLFNKSFKQEIKNSSSEKLIEQVESLLKNKLLNQLSLAKKSGKLVSGFDKVTECLQKRKGVLYLGATDTTDNSKEKIEKHLKGIETITNSLTIEEMGESLGIGKAAHIVITDEKFAKSIKANAIRLKQFKEN